MKKVMLLVLFLFIGIPLTSCSKVNSKEKMIIGKWFFGDEHYIVFNEDNTGIMYGTEEIRIRWKYDEKLDSYPCVMIDAGKIFIVSYTVTSDGEIEVHYSGDTGVKQND